MTAGVKLTYEWVRKFFEDHGCQLLESEYKNARTKMKYKCSCGSESSIIFDSFRKGNRCRKCGGKKTSLKLSMSQEEVAAFFKEQNCELLDEYKGNLIPMKYKCSCGNVSNINWNNFKTKGRRCMKCGTARRSGPNHYEWRKDRQGKMIECRYRFLAARVFKAVGQKNDMAVGNIEANFGYSIEDLERMITTSPNWDSVKDSNWEIDHVFPVCAFINSGIKDVKLINCLDNLQVLSAIDNSKKASIFDSVKFVRWLMQKGVLLP